MVASGFNLGAPGVYRTQGKEPSVLRGAPMDVCAFVGVAPRGNAREPILDETWQYDRPCVGPDFKQRRSVAVAVESFDEYLRRFGGFEGPGRLPLAVASFFDQGGRRAYIVRIVHEYGDDKLNRGGVSRGLLRGSGTPLSFVDADFTEIRFDKNTGLILGSPLRLIYRDGTRVLRFAATILREPAVGPGGFIERVLFDQPLAEVPESVEIVDGVVLRARNEGTWGNQLGAALGFSVKPFVFQKATVRDLRVAQEERMPAGSLLRLTLPGGRRVLRFVTRVLKEERRLSRGYGWRVTFESPLVDIPSLAEVVDGTLLIQDRDTLVVRTERHTGLGLSSIHPRWMGTVLSYESDLVYPHHSWVEGDIMPEDANQLPLEPVIDAGDQPQFEGGEDRYADIEPEDFFDRHWVLGDPDPGVGVHALTHLPDLSSMVAPDLYAPESLIPQEGVLDETPLASGRFQRCLDILPDRGKQERASQDLEGLRLDPRIPAELEEIMGYQERLVGLAEELQSVIALLDVPPGLGHGQILRWRSRFRSSYGAAYHPWLKVTVPLSGDKGLRDLNPASVAAGIIARQEISFGVPHGPANVIAAGVVDVKESVLPAHHDQLHPLGINVFLKERGGIRLTAGRTLSRDPRYRQLTVRRLMMMLRRVFERQTLWMVFENNGPELRANVRHMLRNYLSQLYRAGAFTGAAEEDAFFVRCDDTLNTPRIVDAGRLVVEIGVAPSEPLEFILVRITRGGDQTTIVEV